MKRKASTTLNRKHKKQRGVKKKWYGKKSWRRRGTYKRKKRYVLAVPKTMRVKMTLGSVTNLLYTSYTGYNSQASRGSTFNYSMNPNNLANPLGISQAPPEVLRWAPLYGRYKVVGYKYSVKMIHNSYTTTYKPELLTHMVSHQSMSTDPVCKPTDDKVWGQEESELKNVKLKAKIRRNVSVLQNTGHPGGTVAGKWSTDAILNTQRVDADDRIGTISLAGAVGAPAVVCYHHTSLRMPYNSTGVATLPALASDKVNMYRRIELDVLLFDPRVGEP